jgi:hypothetical protein
VATVQAKTLEDDSVAYALSFLQSAFGFVARLQYHSQDHARRDEDPPCIPTTARESAALLLWGSPDGAKESTKRRNRLAFVIPLRVPSSSQIS